MSTIPSGGSPEKCAATLPHEILYMDIPFEAASMRNPRVNASLVACRYNNVLLGRDVVLCTATRCVLDGLSGEYHSRPKIEERRLPSVGDLKFKSKSLQCVQPCASNV